MKPYATRLREHLAESRAAGIPWEDAWRKALFALTPETDYPLCRRPNCRTRSHDCSDIKTWYRDGYLRTGGSLAGVSALAERRDTIAGEYTAPGMPDSRQCGWGDGCDKPADPWLCAEHSEIVRGICHVTDEERTHKLKRGRLPASMTTNRAECVTPGCNRFASRGDMRCGKHAVKAAA